MEVSWSVYSTVWRHTLHVINFNWGQAILFRNILWLVCIDGDIKGTISDRKFQTSLFSNPQIFFPFFFFANFTEINYIYNNSLGYSIFFNERQFFVLGNFRRWKLIQARVSGNTFWFSQVLVYFSMLHGSAHLFYDNIVIQLVLCVY